MAANQVRNNKRTYKNCPKAILNVVPKDFTKVNFTDLVPGENYQNKALIVSIYYCHLAIFFGKPLFSFLNNFLDLIYSLLEAPK